MIPSKPRSLFAGLALSFVFASFALGQSPTAPTWESARAERVATRTLYVITISHPKSRRTCLVQSIGASEIVCTHRGHQATYRVGEVAALILPGVHTRWYLYAAGFLTAGGAATWGTVVLASVCIPCAAATAVAAFFLYWMAPMSAMATDGDTADTLLYLAPGQSLKVKLKRAG
jgi:hypothetical protein